MDHTGGEAPTKADQRRAQVLEAAARCFNREGFHGASVASIAAEAGLSVGQIYRHFPSKEAVIAAIVEDGMSDWARHMEDLKAQAGDPVDHAIAVVAYHVRKMGDAERAALGLEFLAEAARNPQIAEIVQRVDQRVRANLADVLLRSRSAPSDCLEGRIAMIVALMDGWTARAVKDPSARAEDYLTMVRPVLEVLLAEGKAAN